MSEDIWKMHADNINFFIFGTKLMGKLKATQRGKSGKHRSEDTIAAIKARARRIARTSNRVDRLLMEKLSQGVDEEPSGPLAGIHLGQP